MLSAKVTHCCGIVCSCGQPENQTICEGDTLLWRCQKLYKAGTYKDTVKSLLCPSCDSAYYELHLSLKEPTLNPAENITMILGETLLWRCKMIECNAVGEFVYKDTTYDESCPDEVYQLNLTVNEFEAEEVESDLVICAADTLLWRCQLLYETGTYHDTLKSLLYPAYDSVHYTLNSERRNSFLIFFVKFFRNGVHTPFFKFNKRSFFPTETAFSVK